MHQEKDILFFSNLCDYCKDIMSVIIKKNVKHEYLFVCVDKNHYKLPTFVDRVPLIYTKNGDILYDDTIMKYIEMTTSTQQGGEVDILPFSMPTATNYSDNFSFIDDSMGMENKGYTLLGYEQKIMVTPESEDGKKTKMDTSVLDKYMQDRDADISRFKTTMNNGGNLGRI